VTTLTLAEAEDLAARTLAAIDRCEQSAVQPDGLLEQFCTGWTADRERVRADVEGLREHREDYAICLACERRCTCIDRRPASTPIGDCDCDTHKSWPCPDARRYSDGLLRTARLYGVEWGSEA
jgi:hypothetical protein